MKNSIFALVAFAFFASVTILSSSYQPKFVANKVVAHNCSKARCGFIMANGNLCKNYATGNSYYCWSHNR